MACECWKLCIGGVLIIGIGLLIIIACFMRGASMEAPVVTGEGDIVEQVVINDLSLVNFNDLTDKIEANSSEQMNHNVIKYALIFLIGISFLVSVSYKFIRKRRNRSRNQVLEEGIEMVPLGNRNAKTKRKRKRDRRSRSRNGSSEEELEDRKYEKEKRRRRGGVKVGVETEGKKDLTSEEDEKAGGPRKNPRPAEGGREAVEEEEAGGPRKNLRPKEEGREAVEEEEAGSRKRSRKLRWVYTSDSA